MRARAFAVALAGIAYVIGSYWLMTRNPGSAWHAVIVVAPMLFLAALLAWQRQQRVVAVLAAVAASLLLFQARDGGGLSAQAIYVAEHVAIHLLLAVVFGVTLTSGRESLITMLARRVHGGLTPDMAVYSRKVTIAWTVYFVAMAALSLALFAFAPFPTWAAFAGLVSPLAMLALFIGEHLLRYRLHPEFERATLAQAVRAYADRATPHD
ncbi:MAG: hypothetical protein ABIZ18_11980 [Caldimonas sp.]